MWISGSNAVDWANAPRSPRVTGRPFTTSPGTLVSAASGGGGSHPSATVSRRATSLSRATRTIGRDIAAVPGGPPNRGPSPATARNTPSPLGSGHIALPHQGLHARRLDSNHAREFALGVEQLVCPMAHVAHCDGAVPHHCQRYRVVELAGTLARPAELADERAVCIENQDAGVAPGAVCPSRPVEDMQIAAPVEGHRADRAEGLPRLPFERTDPEHLLEGRVEDTVLARELNDLLGRERGGIHDRRSRDQGDQSERPGDHG